MAGPINQMKDLYKMQKEARAMQKKMRAIKISGISKNEKVEVVIDGTQEVQDVFIDDSIFESDRKRDLEKAIKEAIKDAQKKLQKEMMKDMDMDQIKSMFSS